MSRKDVVEEADVVLVGTYKEGQLDWIKKHGVYNYPVKEEDELKPESCAKVRELWLYASARGERVSLRHKQVTTISDVCGRRDR